jgi:hypothetical protein
MGKKIELTQEQIDWLMTHYSHTKNQDICDKLSMSKETLRKLKKTYNLNKSEEFLIETTKNNLAKANKKLKELGYPMKVNLLLHQKKAIENSKKTIKKKMNDKEWVDNWYKKRGEGLKKTYQKERRRVLFGFEQKTKLRVINTPRNKVMLKHNLRKHGYEIEKNSNIAYINDNTNQSALMEKRGVIMGIKFIKKQM